ncbi:CcoQ/FixQ family Cbb3-type cytochrome c oxidase assembly chaperone [Algicola sagamiensis]|uniref:CcoQ/FixQ family Cbb3-type cytochrome c oxidase assembly chaperone n=1 Tax=Algicola sagamiensis TaxID=163869 RepID=UPI000381E202|nr:CcoQ/FixQ family Cbb3-type cytochrome c oxidase assembly chaperone [Algicola sagamiensis]
MDYGTFRGIFTLVLMVLIIAIAIWAYSKNRKTEFDDAANSIFDEDEKRSNSVAKNQQESNNE